MDRRRFLGVGVVAGLGVAVGRARGGASPSPETPARGPRVISTHPAGLAANREAVAVLERGGSPLDAAERGVMVAEADPGNSSVGYGGLPNADGIVELDAAIMDGATLACGAVAALRGIMHPVAVARRVMEKTPHVLLVGDGARRFARQQGFLEQDLLTPESKRRWQVWKRTGRLPPESHDTIGMVTMDRDGRMAASCTTSGLACKLPGRVGDSPLVGHGLYCDGEAGGAAATGIGEEVIRVCGSYQVVEFMREGLHPHEAVRRVLERILRRRPALREEFIGFIAMRADGEVGYAATTAKFQVAVYLGGEHELRPAERV